MRGTEDVRHTARPLWWARRRDEVRLPRLLLLNLTGYRLHLLPTLFNLPFCHHASFERHLARRSLLTHVLLLQRRHRGLTSSRPRGRSQLRNRGCVHTATHITGSKTTRHRPMIRHLLQVPVVSMSVRFLTGCGRLVVACSNKPYALYG